MPSRWAEYREKTPMAAKSQLALQKLLDQVPIPRQIRNNLTGNASKR
jgi:hypothetical protein